MLLPSTVLTEISPLVLGVRGTDLWHLPVFVIEIFSLR